MNIYVLGFFLLVGAAVLVVPLTRRLGESLANANKAARRVMMAVEFASDSDDV